MSTKRNTLKEVVNKSAIKKLLNEKKLNPKDIKDLDKLLYIAFNQKAKKLNTEYLVTFLLKYKHPGNESLFYKYLFQACELGNLTYIKILLDNGLNVNIQNELGETPIHIAVSKNDIELTLLLAKYKPDISIKSFKDDFTVEDYAKLQNNEKIIKIIKDLKEKNKIKSEIIDFIHADMKILNQKDIDDEKLMEKNKDLDDILNYNGEKIILTKNEESKVKNIPDKNKKKNVLKNKIQKYKSHINFLVDTDFNESHSPKNCIKMSDYYNFERHSKILTEYPFDMKFSKEKTLTSPSPMQKREDIHRSISPSCVQSLTTAHTLNRDFYEASPLYINKRRKSHNKKDELIKFMRDINLPISYANNLIENGFDDLGILITQEKQGMALTYQNLKDIGITSPGERAKILVYLEELAGNLKIFEKDKIFSNKMAKQENNSLYKFLCSINLEEYLSLFEEKGYNNAELLYTQMLSQQPINEEILKNDFEIDKIGHCVRIVQGLKKNTNHYFKKLSNKKHTLSISEDGNPILQKNCEICSIY